MATDMLLKTHIKYNTIPKNKHKDNKNHSTIVKNLSKLISRSFISKLLVDDAENTVLGKLFHASTILLQ